MRNSRISLCMIAKNETLAPSAWDYYLEPILQYFLIKMRKKFKIYYEG